jgi:hypothetical protein
MSGRLLWRWFHSLGQLGGLLWPQYLLLKVSCSCETEIKGPDKMRKRKKTTSNKKFWMLVAAGHEEGMQGMGSYEYLVFLNAFQAIAEKCGLQPVIDYEDENLMRNFDEVRVAFVMIDSPQQLSCLCRSMVT